MNFTQLQPKTLDFTCDKGIYPEFISRAWSLPQTLQGFPPVTLQEKQQKGQSRLEWEADPWI